MINPNFKPISSNQIERPSSPSTEQPGKTPPPTVSDTLTTAESGVDTKILALLSKPIEEMSFSDLYALIWKTLTGTRKTSDALGNVLLSKTIEWSEETKKIIEMIETMRKRITEYVKELEKVTKELNDCIDRLNDKIKGQNNQIPKDNEFIQRLNQAYSKWKSTSSDSPDYRRFEQEYRNAESDYNNYAKSRNLTIDQIVIREYNEKIKSYNEKLTDLNSVGTSLGLPALSPRNPIKDFSLLSIVSENSSFPLLYRDNFSLVDRLPPPPNLMALLDKFVVPLQKQVLELKTRNEHLQASSELYSFYRIQNPLSKKVIDEFAIIRKMEDKKHETIKEMNKTLPEILSITPDAFNKILNRRLVELLIKNKSLSPEFIEKLQKLIITQLAEQSTLAIIKVSGEKPDIAYEFARNVNEFLISDKPKEIILERIQEEPNIPKNEIEPLAEQITAAFNLTLLMFSLATLSRVLELPGIIGQTLNNVPQSPEIQKELQSTTQPPLNERLALPIPPEQNKETLVRQISLALSSEKSDASQVQPQKTPPIETRVEITREVLQLATKLVDGNLEVTRPVDLAKHPLWNVISYPPLKPKELQNQVRSEVIERFTPTLTKEVATSFADRVIALLGVEEMKERSHPASFWNLINKQLVTLEKENSQAKAEAIAEQFQVFMKPNVELFVFLSKLMDPGSSLLMSSKTGIIYSSRDDKIERPLIV